MGSKGGRALMKVEGGRRMRNEIGGGKSEGQLKDREKGQKMVLNKVEGGG